MSIQPQNQYDKRCAQHKEKRAQDLPKKDELDRYLASDPEDDVDKPLEWWWNHKSDYPHLSRMAFFYLSIPGELVGCILLDSAHTIDPCQAPPSTLSVSSVKAVFYFRTLAIAFLGSPFELFCVRGSGAFLVW